MPFLIGGVLALAVVALARQVGFDRDRAFYPTLVIVVAVLAWTALWGFAGMVLAVPLTRSMQLVMYRLPDLRWIAILMSDGDEELPEGT